jgi:hypothetical protein
VRDPDREKIYAEYDDVVIATVRALEQFDTEKLRRVADEAERRGGGWLVEMIRGYVDGVREGRIRRGIS